MAYRISVDTGGTFTDVVVVDDNGQLRIGKALTTPDRAYEGIGAALETVAPEFGLTAPELLAAAETFTYGTTRATNAIVEGKTARTAFFTTAGFPDILLLREGGKLDPFRQIPYPPPYVPRYLTFEIAERIDSEGDVFIPLDEGSVRAALEQCRDLGVQAIGVSLLWSIVNPAHELRIGELIAEHLPGVPFTLAHQLNPIIREYRRTSSCVIDASLKPLMQEHLSRLERDLRAAGFGGHFFVATSFGGSWRPEEVIERPIYSVGSGPSMAPVAAVTYGKAETGSEVLHEDLLVCDTGGTTFDVGLVSNGEINYTAETWLGGRWTGHITGIRAVDVKSIGAGGGSIAWLDPGGLLRVGPHSAGADPGPACYGRGGTLPTVTDCAVVLGYIDPAHFLGGRLALDVDAARAAVQTHIAEPLTWSVEDAASAVLVIATENIVGAIREITIAQGIDPREVTIVAGGGASGLNIVPIARELGVGKVLLPSTAGALSACGAMYADVISEFSVSRYAETRDLDFAAVSEALATVEARAQAFLDGLTNIDPVATRIEFMVAARYRQQVWELDIPIAGSRIETEADVQALEQTFHETHRRVFAVDEPGQYLECLVWKSRATAVTAKPAVASRARGTGEALERSGAAFFRDHGALETPRYDGALLPPETVIAGPAIILEPTTTVVVYPGSTATVTALGNYLLHIAPEPATAAAATLRAEAPTT
ncbi:MAG: hydantoinase/oxoprolinase family protein [Thermomicrobiales bacterium]|nr:hydantoinase/oxoprolinase family protein [Thermomicrobiales bacterium]